MNNTLYNLQPEKVWFYFNEITKIPRPSKKEGKIAKYLKEFAQNKKLEFKQDSLGNTLIIKAAVKGYEQVPTVILQSHMDMVCEKNTDVIFDFEKDSIQTIIKGDWMYAQGTTLGADNGIGIATELAILDSTDIQHGRLECLFTIDEETGLTGAFSLEKNFFSGKILINLDSEDEGQLFIGCAGGIDTLANLPYKTIPTPDGLFFFQLKINGLPGGHSGGDIHKIIPNANKLLAHFLKRIADETELYISYIQGGNLRNAIARDASVIAGVPFAFKERVRILLNIFAVEMEEQYKEYASDMNFQLESENAPLQIIEPQTSSNLLNALLDCPHGVITMSKEIDGLVETSTNLASIKTDTEKQIIQIATSQRSSIEKEKNILAFNIEQIFKKAGANVSHSEGYPGWKPNMNSKILEIAHSTYKSLFNKEPLITAIHAGLECGLFLQKQPDLDMVSFGPTLRGVHSPQECIQISTVPLFWMHLLEILKNIR